jgi:hypothetical protein
MAVMEIAGGAIVGYCATGNLRIDNPSQHDDDGDHPRKYGAIDKEIRHVLTAPV